ncbi:MAG: hypothetical protein CMM53_06715 [Rhodospirillaceae bacterium]|nr:hypothetical protein [Rhodospirillaceae bacterium]|tara:strand:+ start:528 stop:1112 length:585 start_codon:yes stop_codon:yes gene_type:complete
MKFLIFNAAVILALVVLLVDHPKVNKVIPHQLTGLVGTVKQKVAKTTETHKSVQNSEIIKSQKVQTENKKRKSPNKNTNKLQKTAQPVTRTIPTKKTAKVEKTVPIKVKNTVSKTTPTKQMRQTTVGHRMAKTALNKTAIKNNSEIKNLLAKKQTKESPSTKIKEGLMSDKIRRRDLMTLSDEMEFIHARSITD